MKVITQLREQRGWSQEDLAKRLGVTQPTVANWETGARNPLLKQINKMASIFGVTKAYILGEVGGKHDNKTSSDYEERTRNPANVI